jgi:hypothetical protein
VSENRVLRKIFGLKRGEVTGGGRKLYNRKIGYLYSSPSIIRIINSRSMKWAGHVTQIERTAFRNLVKEPKGKRPIERPRNRTWMRVCCC